MVKNHGTAGSYVIVHMGVDGWRQGDVVKAEEFKLYDKDGREIGDRLERLRGLGAVRPANDAEAAAGRGFASPVPGLSVASQMRLATLDVEIDSLRRLIADQQDKLNAYLGMGVRDEQAEAAALEEDPALSPVLEQRRADIEALKKQAQDNHARLEALAQKAGEKGKEEREKADPELSGSAGPPFGEGAEGGGGEGGHHRRRRGGGSE